MAEILEIVMIVSFGASWPMNVVKSYRARTAKGKSLGFLLLILFGYVAGIASKLVNEAYMASIQDPELPRQQKEHQAFVNKVNSYRFSDITDETAKEMVLELLEYLSKWLMGHILGSDILIGQFEANDKPNIPVFTDKFKTGIPMIDEEHKALFDIIERIYKTIEVELVHDKFDLILDILDELKEYTRVHFADEENYMKEIGYDGLAQQRILHEKFVETLNEVNLDEVDDNQMEYLYEVLNFLQNWLINHILKVDKLIPQQ